MLPPIAPPQRQNGSARRCDADALVELLDGALDVVRRLENRVAVENELDVGIELPRLPLDGRRLADRLVTLDGDQLDPVLLAERPRTHDRAVGAAVVDQDHAMRAQCLAEQAGEAQDDRLRFVERRNDDVDSRLSPIFSGRRRRAIGPFRQACKAQRGVGSKHEIGENCHSIILVLTR